ncbi:MAG: lipase family protein, partial [Planctomycetes bacterium]|nr:lipase family protein [Planctomycetota bacterium]
MDYTKYFSALRQVESYDEQNALSLAIACDLAYEDNEDVLARVIKNCGYSLIGFRSIVKEPDIHTQYYVMANEENVVIVFRGSDDLNDWLGNFQAVYDPGPLEGTKVHEGFQDALFPALIGLTNLVDTAELNHKKLWITGYSLGGALSSICAGMLMENGYPVYGLYTFASPRPGNASFQEQLNAKVSGPHFRVVNTGDVIPHIPPEPFYSHPGKRVILNKGVCPVGLLPSCFAFLQYVIFYLQ